MAEILRGLDAVVQIKDDIVVHGTGDEHEQQLEEVCQRDRVWNQTLKSADRTFQGPSSVSLFCIGAGHILSGTACSCAARMTGFEKHGRFRWTAWRRQWRWQRSDRPSRRQADAAAHDWCEEGENEQGDQKLRIKPGVRGDDRHQGAAAQGRQPGHTQESVRPGTCNCTWGTPRRGNRAIRNLRERNWFPGMAEKWRMFMWNILGIDHFWFSFLKDHKMHNWLMK